MPGIFIPTSRNLLALLAFSGVLWAAVTEGVFAGGGWSGNGGDLNKGSDNPWFLGSKPVKYCIEKSSEYPFSTEDLQALVSEAFSAWKAFFQKYGMHSLHFPPELPDNRMIFAFPDANNRPLSLNFTGSECQLGNTENLQEDHIYFLFGSRHDLVEVYKKLNEEAALGVALRPSYRHDSFRNSGIIWLGQFTGQRSRLLHLVLHELGHIFGMPHDSVFVMSSDVAYMLTDQEHFSDDFFGRIESFFWPFKLRVGDEVILTSRQGLKGPHAPGSRPGRDHSPDRFCPDPEFSPNQNLLPEVRTWLGLPIEACHRIALTKISDGLSPLPDKKSFYRLRIESPQSLIHEFRAVFTSHFPPAGARNRFKGPSLFTGWKIPSENSDQTFWHPLPLDPGANWWHSSGYLETGRGHTVAAKLNFEAGPFLEIFLPFSKHWWLLKSLPDFEHKLP